MREDHLDLHGDLRVRDPAGIRRLRVADAGGESHLRGARMPGARALHLGSVFRQLFFDVVQSAAGDAEIAVGLHQIRCACRRGGKRKHQGAEQGTVHHVASSRTLLYGRCRRNGIDFARITHG